MTEKRSFIQYGGIYFILRKIVFPGIHKIEAYKIQININTSMTLLPILTSSSFLFIYSGLADVIRLALFANSWLTRGRCTKLSLYTDEIFNNGMLYVL